MAERALFSVLSLNWSQGRLSKSNSFCVDIFPFLRPTTKILRLCMEILPIFKETLRGHVPASLALRNSVLRPIQSISCDVRPLYVLLETTLPGELETSGQRAYH